MPEIIDFNKSKGTFYDTAQGDVDFYTYWYSICYVTGMLNVYRRIFRDVESYENVIRKFLSSRGIAYINESNLDLLTYIYTHYREQLEKRGTSLINERAGQTEEIGVTGVSFVDTLANIESYYSGIGVLSNALDLVGILSASIDLGSYHEIQFDCLLADESGSQYDTDGGLFNETANAILIQKISTAGSNHIASYNFIYKCASVSHIFLTDVNVLILNTIKFIRGGDFVALYINGDYIGRSAVTLANDYNLSYLFADQLPAVANLKLTILNSSFEITDTYSWSCNEGSGFTIESDFDAVNSAQLAIEQDTQWTTTWRRSSLFANTDYVSIDGEVRRLVNFIDGECLLELAATGELGLTIDMSSPLSEEASCANLNKAYQKGAISKLSEFPLLFSNAIKPVVETGYIKYTLPNATSAFYGINVPLIATPAWKSSPDYKILGQMPFIPINVATDADALDGYEISFVIHSNADIDLKFGIATYNEDLVNLAAKTKKYTTNAASDMFLDEVNFVKCKNADLWIRGVYSLKHDALINNALNIGLGSNLYNDSQSEVKYIVPIIAFVGSSAHAVAVMIKDIVVRPLSLNTSKGQVANKNTMIGFLRNDSGQTNANITKFIDEKLIPYNCTTNIQYL